MNRSKTQNQPTSEAILTEIELFASNLFTPREIGIAVDLVDFEDRLDDDDSPEFRAYMRGKLKTKLEIRKSVISLAKQGSGPAQTIALQLLEEQEASEP